MKMIRSDQMWKKLEPFLRVDKALEEGFSNGKYTKILAKYAKNVMAIDVSEDFLKIATEYLKNIDNVKLKLMNAQRLEFPNKSFDILLNSSFHEFDLVNGEYSLNLKLKEKIVKEMIRVSNTIVFVEPDVEAVTNELFKVFSPIEKHADRIRQSNYLIEEVMNKYNYKKVLDGYSFNEDKYKTKQELEEDMLSWWADIKVPSNSEDKMSMIDQIDQILDKAGMLAQLKVVEKVKYWVFRK